MKRILLFRVLLKRGRRNPRTCWTWTHFHFHEVACFLTSPELSAMPARKPRLMSTRLKCYYSVYCQGQCTTCKEKGEKQRRKKQIERLTAFMGEMTERQTKDSPELQIYRSWQVAISWQTPSASCQPGHSACRKRRSTYTRTLRQWFIQ